MATKFSDFTAQAATATAFVVGYDGSTNTQYSQTQLTDFVLDGTLGGNKILKFNGNTLQLGNQGTDTTGVKFFHDGRIQLPSRSGAVLVTSYGSQFRQNFLRLYTNTTFGATVTGYTTLASSSNWAAGGTSGDNYNINARLGIIGVHNNATSHALRVQNSDLEDIFSVRNDKYVTVTGNNSISNFFALKNEATWTMLDAGDGGSNNGQLRIKSNNNNRFWFKANSGLSIADAGAVTLDSSAVLKADSTTKGLLPPRMTNTQRDAITSPTAGLMLYSSTDSKLQFYNGSAWTDAASGGNTIYTGDGSINEDRVITVGHDATTKVTYNTSFESSKSNDSTTRNSDGNIVQIKETYTSQVPVGYSQTRGAVLKLRANTSSGTANAEGYINAFIINSGSSDYTNRDQMGFRTNKAFVFKATDTSWPLYFAIQGGPSNNYKTLKYSGASSGGLFQLGAGNARTTKFTLSDAGTHYRYIEALNTGKFELGRKTGSSASDEAFITMNGIGSWNGDIGVGINQGTPTATLHVTGSGATSSTTSFLVENSNGDDILNIKDDGAFALGRGATPSISQSVVIGDTATANQRGISIGYSTTSGDSGVTIGWDAGVSFATGRNINIGYTARASGLSSILLTSANGNGPVNNTENYNFSVYMTSQSTPDFRVIGNEGMIPPSITTTVRDAISSPVLGSTIYNTTDNKLQFYNGSAWTDAGGGGDSIYTADGNIVAARTINDRTGGFTGTAGNHALKMNVRNSGALMVAGYQNNGDPGTANNCFRWGPGATNGSMNVRGNLALSSGGGAISLIASNGSQYTTISQTGVSFNTTGNQEYLAPAIGFGTSASTNYRVRIKGATSTSTGYGLQVQNSSNDQMLSIRDDGAIAIGRGATLFDEDSNGIQDVVIGYGASTDYSGTYFSTNRRVAIGYNADVNAGGGIAIGHSAAVNSTEGIAIGYSAQTTAYRATAVGYDASAGSYGIAVGAYSSTTGPNSVAIGGTQNATTGYGVHVGIGGSAGISSVSIGASSVSGTNATSIGKSASSTGVGAFTAGASMANSGAYSFAFGGFAYGAAGATNTDSNSVKFYMNATTPQLNFHLNNDSWWNSSGNFGFGITNPTDRLQVPTTIGIIGDSVNAGKLKLYCEAGTAHHVAIEGPAHTNAGPSYTIKLPNTAPSAGQVLASDANGNLSWKSPHQLDFSNLPTSDPGVEGRLYNDEGTVKVSIP